MRIDASLPHLRVHLLGFSPHGSGEGQRGGNFDLKPVPGNRLNRPASYQHSRPRAGEEAGMRRFLAGFAAIAAALIATTQPAAACAGLIGPNGAVNLLRTTTFAGYHDGVEHYVTSFQFAGGSGQFGSLIPLPGIPDKVEKGGDWTLQRLIRETTSISL